jgi:hypothetical protein
VGSENYYADKSCADRSDQDRAGGDIFGSFDPRVKFRGGHVAQRFEGGVESLSTPYGSDCENDGKPLDSAYSDRKSERDNDDRRERVYARVGFGSEHLADSTECVTKCLDTIFFVKTHLDRSITPPLPLIISSQSVGRSAETFFNRPFPASSLRDLSILIPQE